MLALLGALCVLHGSGPRPGALLASVAVIGGLPVVWGNYGGGRVRRASARAG